MFSKFKKNFFLLISFFFLIYFLFNLMNGERGLFSYFKKKEILFQNNQKEISLKKQIEEYEFKNLLLTENLDLDFIETLIRKKFLFGKENETVYIIKDNND